MLPADVYTPYNDNLTQSFNRYAYAFNNPLSYTDPSGYFPVIILPAIVITAQSVAAAVAGYTAIATFTAATVYFTATLLSTSGAVNAALAGSIKGVNYGYFNDYTGTFSNDPGANSFLIRGNQAGVQYPLAPDVASIGASPLATPAPQFPAMAQLAGSGQVVTGGSSWAGALPGAAVSGGSWAAGKGAPSRWDQFLDWLNQPVGNDHFITKEDIARDRAANPGFYNNLELAATFVPVPGSSFGKLGKIVTKPGLKITSISRHALNRSITRGVTSSTILNVVKNPLLVFRQTSGNYMYLSRSGVVVLNSKGRLVTTYGANFFDDTIQGIISFFH